MCDYEQEYDEDFEEWEPDPKFCESCGVLLTLNNNPCDNDELCRACWSDPDINPDYDEELVKLPF